MLRRRTRIETFYVWVNITISENSALTIILLVLYCVQAWLRQKIHAKILMLATFNRKEKKRLENEEEWEEEEEEKLEERNSEDMERLEKEILEKKKEEEGLNSLALLHKNLPGLLKVSGGLSILLLFF
jgi:hypothetical protein